MKNLFFTLLLLTGISICPQLATACINPDSVVQTIVRYDTIQAQPCVYAKEVEIRLTNIRLMNEAPNKICACALASFAEMFTELRYVAFVDSGTNNPYQGFAEFNANPAASSAWDGDQPGHGGWEGLIAHVINSGLKANDPVEMVIRAEAPANTVIVIDSGCGADSTLMSRLISSSLGTDAWDEDNQQLEASHQSVRSFDPLAEIGSSSSLVQVTSQYFETLDTAILNNFPTGIEKNTPTCFGTISIYPNPTSEKLNIVLQREKDMPTRVELVNMAGHTVTEWEWQADAAYDVSGISAGIYFIRISSERQVYISKSVVIRR